MRYQVRPRGAGVFGRFRRGLGQGSLGLVWAPRGGDSALTMPRKGVETVVGAAGAAANAGLCSTLMQAQTAR
jgi:hypothetical protein